MSPEQRASEIQEREGDRIAELQRAAAKLVKAPLPRATKGIRIVEIAGQVSRTIMPHLACARGCSECCSWSLNISAYEARLIGAHVGRQPMRLGRRMGESDSSLEGELRKRFTGVPCPFLEPGPRGCTIYAVRPLACRTHHTLMDDESNCRLELDDEGVAVNRTPSLDLSTVGKASALIFRGEDFGDIREFFPPARTP